MLEHAIKYARRGFRVFPVKAGGKTPLIQKWPDLASTDELVLRKWWAEWPEANIGLATGKESGVFVLDVDVSNNKKGQESLNQLEADTGEIPDTLESMTGSGGRHLFFKTSAREVRNKQNLRPGLDVRGDGGYVVLPPSVHECGRKYDWPVGSKTPIARCPIKLLNVLAPPTRKSIPPWERPPKPAPIQERPRGTPTIERASKYLHECEPAIEGAGGHNALLWAARSMVVGFELSESDALSLLWNEYNPRCSPPWDRNKPSDAREFERKVSEAQRTWNEKPKGWLLDEFHLRTGDDALTALGRRSSQALLANWDAKHSPQADDEPIQPKTHTPFPLHCLPNRIAEHCELVADVNVVDAGGVGLSAMVTGGSAMGNTIRLQLKKGFEVSPILWGMIIARSGSNKSGPFREIIKPLRLPVPMERIVNSMLNPQGQLLIEDATTEAVIDVMSRSHRGLCMANGEGSGWVGAFDRYSQGAKKKTSVDESIWLKLWDCDTYQKNRKTDSENILIHAAACAVIACIQPEKMAECFDPQQFASGLVPRLLVVNLPKRFRGWSEREIDNEDIEFWQNIIMFLRTIPFANMDPNTGQYGPNIITLTPDAKEMYVLEFNRLAHVVDNSDDMTALFAAKAQGGVGRLALVLHGLGAACEEHDILDPVSLETMEKAIELQGYFLGEQLKLYGLAGQQYVKKHVTELVALINDKFDGEVSTRQLTRHNKRKWPDSKTARKALEMIITAGMGQWDSTGRNLVITKEKEQK